jgi:glycosyltransferase involved in cell wall biosynthesis
MDLRIYGQLGILSFRKQVELIKRAAEDLGYRVILVDIQTPVKPFQGHVGNQIQFIVGMPHLLMWAFRYGWKAYADRSLCYATVEGRPKVNKHIQNLLRGLRVVGVSRFAAERLAEVGAEVEGWVPHALDPVEIDQALGIPRDKHEIFRVGYVGSPIPRKGLMLLNEAAKIVWDRGYKNIEFILWTQKWGDCPLPEGPNIHIQELFGSRPHLEVLYFMRSLDLYVQPSLAEGFCIPIIEAQALGIPVVSSSGGPMGELNNPKVGYVVNPTELRLEDHGMGQDFYCYYYDPRDMADKIIEAYENPSQRDEKGLKALDQSKEYYYDKVYPRLLRML